jgi:hypothetical protein
VFIAGGYKSECSELRLHACTFEQTSGFAVRVLSQGSIVVYAGYLPLQGAAVGCVLSQLSGMQFAEWMSQQGGMHIVSAGCC